MSSNHAKQFYSDIAEATKRDPGQFISSSQTKIYNALLREAKAKYPQHAILGVLDEIGEHEQTRYRDILTLAGQLKLAYEENEPILMAVL